MDLLFKEYASPFVLLDEVISSGKFCDFLDTFEDQRQERQLWEYYIHKLPPWNNQSFDEFKRTIKVGKRTKIERPSDEQLEATVKGLFDMLNNFEIPQEGGEKL